jgi:hypothetical protein
MQEYIMQSFVAVFDAAGNMSTYKNASTKLISSSISVTDENGVIAYEIPLSSVTDTKIQDGLGVARELEIYHAGGQIVIQPMEEDEAYINQYETQLGVFAEALNGFLTSRSDSVA